MWSFKHKRNPRGELIKHKARLCVHAGKQIKDTDYWNTHAPIVQHTTDWLMLIMHQTRNCSCSYLDYVLSFTQALTHTNF